MKTFISLGIIALLLAGCNQLEQQTTSAGSNDPKLMEFADKMPLDENFVVYVKGTTAVNVPNPGFEKKIIPTNNDYRGVNGCYVACYSHEKINSIYPFNNDIFIMGQVRLPGSYNQRICMPNSNIDANKLCNDKIKTCNGKCWAGGDTGGWFGIQ